MAFPLLVGTPAPLSSSQRKEISLRPTVLQKNASRQYKQSPGVHHRQTEESSNLLVTTPRRETFVTSLSTLRNDKIKNSDLDESQEEWGFENMASPSDPWDHGRGHSSIPHPPNPNIKIDRVRRSTWSDTRSNVNTETAAGIFRRRLASMCVQPSPPSMQRSNKPRTQCFLRHSLLRKENSSPSINMNNHDDADDVQRPCMMRKREVNFQKDFQRVLPLLMDPSE